jgi:hypothetical protein
MSDAKRALRKTVGAWARGRGEAPQLLRSCDACGEERWVPLDRRIAAVELDAHLPDGRRADALLADASGRARLVVRLADGSRLRNRATSVDVSAPFVELSGAALLAEPLRWRPLRANGLPRWRCRCAQARPLPVDDAFSLRVLGCPLALRRDDAKASTTTYASVVHDCARCHFFVGIGYADAERRRVSLYCSFGATGRRRVGPVPAPRLPGVEVEVPVGLPAERSSA